MFTDLPGGVPPPMLHPARTSLLPDAFVLCAAIQSLFYDTTEFALRCLISAAYVAISRPQKQYHGPR